MTKLKTWINAKPKQRLMRLLFIYLIIVFVVGLTMKLISSSLSTANLVSLQDQRDGLSPAAPAAAHASLAQGVADQSIGVYVGWSMIALKIYIYSITFVTFYKVIYKNKDVSTKWLWFMFARFITLIVGLSVGEGLTIYFTERNKHGEALSAQQVYSYISPAMSILFAIGVPPFIYKIIKMRG